MKFLFFGNGCHLRWRAGQVNTIFKVNHKIPSQPNLVALGSMVSEKKIWMWFLAPCDVMWCIVISIHSSLSFNISIRFSQTTDPVGTKLIRNVTKWFSTYYLIFFSLENPIILSYWLKFAKSSQKLWWNCYVLL